MSAFLGFLLFTSFILLILGLVKPSLVLFKFKNPTRLKVIGLWLLSMIVLVIVAIITTDSTSEQEKKSDSEIKSDSTVISDEKKESKVQQNDIEHLKREIESINKGIDFDQYKSSIESLQMELVIFSAWEKIISDALNSTNSDVNTLGKELQGKVKKIQVQEFPLMRKAYAKILHEKLWVENIEVEVYGNKSTTLQFTGGIFANNRNKQETQNTLREALEMYRFKKINYKWYKYDDEYTYYELNSPADMELVKFD